MILKPSLRNMRHRVSNLALTAGLLAALFFFAAFLFSPLFEEVSAAPPGEKTIEPKSKLQPIASFDNAVRPFVKKYCVECHGNDDPEEGLSLESFHGQHAVTKNAQQRKIWRKVTEQIRGQVMPPEYGDQPTPDERKKVVAWLTRELKRADCTTARNPGNVTLRRLNRVEYTNTVRDWLGVEFAASETFPRDNVGYGFDNIADVQSLSPIHLEKYLDAAEAITQQAIHAHEDITQPRLNVEPKNLKGGRVGSQGLLLWRDGEVTADVRFPENGTYLLRVLACGDQAGDEFAKMQFLKNGKPLGVVDVAAEDNAPEWYSTLLQLKQGKNKLGLAFINDYYNPKSKDPNQRDRNLTIVRVEIFGPVDAQLATQQKENTRLLAEAPSPKEWRTNLWIPVARRTLRKQIAFAFRRPAKEPEVTRYFRLLETAKTSGQSYEQGMRHVVQALLISPHFLFRGSLTTAKQQIGDVAIDEFELASRLSYFLWNSMPDEKLYRLAKSKRLRQNLDAEVRRMLADPKSRRFAQHFVGQWLEIVSLVDASPDPIIFPSFTENLRSAMSKEPILLFENVMKHNRSIITLLDADYTFANESLAKLYGIQGVKGNAMRRVSLKKNKQRGGVLTMAGVLTVSSYANRSSPPRRGKWVLENLLDESPPPPPPNTPSFDKTKAIAGDLSPRKQFELHRSNPICASCHVKMDPIGFSLEHYDAIGKWRERIGKHVIDDHGKYPDGREFVGATGLKTLMLQEKAKFRRTLSARLLTYALGRGLEAYDDCTVNDITARLAKHDDRFTELILGIVHSAPFQKRRVE